MNATIPATRSELIKWINSILLVNITSIEKASNGAIPCQIIDLLFPGSMTMQRVNFAAQDQFEASKNYRLMQTAIAKKNIDINFDVDKCSKGRPQEILQLLQCLKNLFDKFYDGSEYSPIQRRELSKGGKTMNITLNDIEIMENEIAMNSSRVSIESTRSQQMSLNAVRSGLATTASHIISPHPAAPMVSPQRRGALRLHDHPKDIEILRETNRILEGKVTALETAVNERNRLIESLRKEGLSMYRTLQKVEAFIIESESKGENSDLLKQLLDLMYKSFQTEHPDEEEKWANEGISNECVDDTLL